jgi:glucose uptake protein GlcU
LKTEKKIVEFDFFLIPGFMFVCADVSYSIASTALTQAISLPIGACGPQIVSSIWGVAVFKEIRGTWNLAFLATGFAIAIVASMLIGLSM